VENRFQNLPFKCNLQRYTTGATAGFGISLCVPTVGLVQVA
jgi:hypothetical protein